MRCADRNENDDDNNNSDHNDSTALITPVKIIIWIRMITIMTKMLIRPMKTISV